MTITNTTVTNEHALHAPSRRHDTRPRSVGVVRSGTSSDEGRHAIAIERHARSLGLHHIYTVRPPHDHADPVGYALDIAAELHAQVIVVYDLSAVDHSPDRVCEIFGLATVVPPESRVRAHQRTNSRTSRSAADRVRPDGTEADETA